MNYGIEINDNNILIFDKFEDFPTFDKIGSEYIIKIGELENILCLTSFDFEVSGDNPNRYLKSYYRISKDERRWTDWQTLDKNINNYPETDPSDKLFIQIKFIREGSDVINEIELIKFDLNGVVNRKEEYLDDSESSFVRILPSSETIIKSPFRMKVYKIIDIEIIPEMDDVYIDYRFSQDSSRTWTEWEPFTKENITTVRINPIRFFEIEYRVNNKSRRPIKINDINLIGDFQNITKDYHKTNLFGIRQDCSSNDWGYYDENGIYHPNTNMNADGKGEVNPDNSGVFSDMTDDQIANLYNPYDQSNATNLLEKLSVDSEQIFGHKVKYFVTDPDQKGQDHSLNEYQLYNINCSADIKVSISGNEFPDNQIKMNIFDLDLFDSMEAHITKKQFKKIFGEQRRPAKEDLMYFCQVNRMYIIDHAQQFRSFNNASVFYKIILKKYNQKANVKAGNSIIETELAKLNKNSTIDTLFGLEIEEDKKSIANMPMTETLTRDTRRLEYKADIRKYLLENSTNIISKSFYELNTVPYMDMAIKYNDFLREFKVSDNLSLTMWFSINNYMIDEEYTFMNNYDEVNKIGWKITLVNNTISVLLNEDRYNFELKAYVVGDDPDALNEKVWYALVLNIDQRQRTTQIFIYKRNVNKESDAPRLNSTILKLVYIQTLAMIPIFYYIDDMNITPTIYASDMKITNIRVFTDIIKRTEHNKILNQYMIGTDYKYILFGDNATKKLELPNIPFNEDY